MKNLFIAICCVAFAGTTFAATAGTPVYNQQKNNEQSLVGPVKMSPLQIGDNDSDKGKKGTPGI